MRPSEFAPITLGRVIRTRRAGALTFTQAEHAPRTALSMHAHERANITFVLSGAFGERLPGRSLAVAPHEIVIKRPGERHANDYGNAAALSMTIELDESWFAAQTRFYDVLLRSAHIRSPAAAEALLRLLRELRHDDDGPSAVAAEELVLDALAALGRLPLPNGRASWIGDVRAFLDERYLESVSLTNVSETFGVDRTLLARLFRREVGSTIGGYVRMLRVQQACRELMSTSRSITDIAFAAGFADHAHLCRVFRSSIGATPTEFRLLRS
jgi:AraC family transcriptional regulator